MPPWLSGGTGPTGLVLSCAPSGKNILGMLGPVMSASRMPTLSPWRRRATASRPLTSDLPTPPLPLITATTRRMSLSASTWPISGAGTPMPIRPFSSAVISDSSTSTSSTPSSAPTVCLTSSAIWPRRGQPSVVRARTTVTRPPSIWTWRIMPRSTRLRCISGSMTPLSASTIVASVTIRSPTLVAEISTGIIFIGGWLSSLMASAAAYVLGELARPVV